MKSNNLFILCFISTLFCFNTLYAKKVEISVAKQVAANFYLEKNPTNISAKSISVSNSFTVSENSTPLYYVFNFNNNGFVIVSADDAVIPILGYSTEGLYSDQNQSPEFAYWMDSYKKQILEVKKTNYTGNEKSTAEWSRLSVSQNNFKSVKSTIIPVAPLTLSTWNQLCCYDNDCPIDSTTSDAPGDCYHAVTGCVATAMSQVMYYYRYPNVGQGSHSYNGGKYGTLSANFNTLYDWGNMTNSCSGENDAIAKLISHCGISVNMSYSPTGSGSQVSYIPYALKTYFKYSTNVKDLQRGSNPDTTWEKILMTELNNNRPMVYGGYDPTAGEGHAWVCDGYSNDSTFHFNWGWEGAGDGYYYINNLNPEGSNFSQNHEIVYGIYPGSGYPYYCSSTVQKDTTDVGTIVDGSGPSDYQNNDDCSWLIQPTNIIDHLRLTFDYLNTDTNDVVTIYDGATTSSPILGTFSGRTLPTNVITSTSHAVLVRFQSNSSVTAPGWQISYTSVYPVYCSGTKTLTAQQDTISDGSGANNYNNNTICRWYIEPTGATCISLHFIDFSLDSLNGDYVKVSDLNTNTPLAIYKGKTLPKDQTYYTSEVMVMFYSNSSVTGNGWSLYYSTTPLGINTYSNIKALNVYPIPANNLLHISFNLLSGNDVKLQLVNLTGQIIYETNQTGNISVYNKDIDVSRLSKGIYSLRIISAGETINKKVVIE